MIYNIPEQVTKLEKMNATLVYSHKIRTHKSKKTCIHKKTLNRIFIPDKFLIPEFKFQMQRSNKGKFLSTILSITQRNKIVSKLLLVVPEIAVVKLHLFLRIQSGDS